MSNQIVQMIQDALATKRPLPYFLYPGTDSKEIREIWDIEEKMEGGKRPIIYLTIRNPNYGTVIRPLYSESYTFARIAGSALGLEIPQKPSQLEQQAEDAVLASLKGGSLNRVIADHAREPSIYYDETTGKARIVWYSYIRTPGVQSGVYTRVEATNNDVLGPYVTILLEYVGLRPSRRSPEHFFYNVFSCPSRLAELARFPDDGSMAMSDAFAKYGAGTKVRISECGCEVILQRERMAENWVTWTSPCDSCKNAGYTRGVYKWFIYTTQVEVIDA